MIPSRVLLEQLKDERTRYGECYMDSERLEVHIHDSNSQEHESLLSTEDKINICYNNSDPRLFEPRPFNQTPFSLMPLGLLEPPHRRPSLKLSTDPQEVLHIFDSKGVSNLEHTPTM